MERIKRVLVCPLDWGLGHASRCVPIIRCLRAAGYEVIIAADKHPYQLLQVEFPQLAFVRFPGYEVRYSKRFFGLNIGLQLPRILRGIVREHRFLKKVIKAHQIDLVISDNRFGCWNKSVPSIFITHQIFIQAPIGQSLIRSINLWFLSKYRQVWIPDIEGEFNLSGNLGHEFPLPSHAHFIGLLSRFKNEKSSAYNDFRYDLCAVVSGPEPQRSLFEKILIEEIKKLKLRVVLIRGLVSSENEKAILSENFEQINHTNCENFKRILQESRIVLARSGYSTIMDLATLGKKAIFVPTPGQTEQEYLARRFKEKNLCYSTIQNGFDLKIALENSKEYSGFSQDAANRFQKEKLLDLIEQLNLPEKK